MEFTICIALTLIFSISLIKILKHRLRLKKRQNLLLKRPRYQYFDEWWEDLQVDVTTEEEITDYMGGTPSYSEYDTYIYDSSELYYSRGGHDIFNINLKYKEIRFEFKNHKLIKYERD